MTRPLIAVLGSLDAARQYDPPLRDLEVGRQACEQLGRELAHQGCDIVVYSSKPGFVEADIVRGYVASGEAQPGSIQIRSPLDSSHGQFPEIRQHRELFDARADSSPDWEVSFYRSLVETQGVLLVGGGRSTLATGLIALAFDVPIVALAAFGGSAQKVWTALDRVRNEAAAEDISAMAAAWHDGSSARLVTALVAQGEQKVAKAEAKRRQERRQSKRAAIGLSIAAVLLLAGLATIPLIYAWKPGTAGSLLLLCAGPLLFATSGAIIRTAFDEGIYWLRPAVLGLAAGAISFLLFVAAQLATTPNTLEGSGARRLLFFVLPLGFIAGLTFDAVYARLRTVDVTRTDVLKRP
jgi:hypothetical protein